MNVGELSRAEIFRALPCGGFQTVLIRGGITRTNTRLSFSFSPFDIKEPIGKNG